MNYYNPYFMPYSTVAPANTGLISRLFGGKLTLSSILSGTGKVVNFANQAIPLVKQINPVIKNASTMFKVMNEFKKVETPTVPNTNQNSVQNNEENKKEVVITTNTEGPTFFL